MLRFALLASLVASPALAQDDPAYDGTEEAVEEAEKPETDLSAELGASFTSGNAFSLSVNGGVNGEHRWQQNRFSFGGAVNLNLVKPDTDGDGTVADEDAALDLAQERIAGFVRYDRFFGEYNALYVSGNSERDRLAGLLWRFNEQVGYRRVIVKTDKTDLDFEIGLAYTQENLAETDDGTHGEVLDYQYLAARAFFGFTHQFNDAVAIGDDIEFFQNLTNIGEVGSDSRLYNTFFITAALSDRFSIKFSHRLAFDNVPAGEEYAKLDQTTMLTLVAKIF